MLPAYCNIHVYVTSYVDTVYDDTVYDDNTV